ncbi:MAG TPA: Gfo/Idh/MocA family oxidoreductase [Acidimicrobiales bacterium]|nr:Gfo/Idh/MocA family oxidoreductase [Acidimicrobiales bacterium]
MTLRVAMLGYGFIAGLHTEAARAAGVEVVGVAGHRAGRAEEFAARHGIGWAGDDWQALVARPDVDAVVIGTPNSLHHPQAMWALAQGKHVLVDKPMALTVAEGREMAAAADAAGRVLAVGHMWRHRSEVVALRDRIAAGGLGRVVRTHGWGVHAGWGPSGWFTDPELAGGGALIDMGIHALDTARFLLGDPRPVRVQASIGHGEFADHGLDDDGLVLVDWDDGTRSLVEFGWWQPRLGGLEADTEVLGTAGHARIWDTVAPPDDYVHCSVPMYAAQMADFADACATGRTPVGSAEVGLTALAIVEAAYAAAALAPRSRP